MKKIAGIFLVLLAAGAHPAYCADPSPAAPVAESMWQARQSAGFEARISVTLVLPDGRRTSPMKLAVIGQFGVDRQRLLIRGISPDKVRNRYIAAERTADGRIRSIEYAEPGSEGTTQADPFANLFESGLVIWDMLGSWWTWPKQIAAGSGQAAGHDCTLVRSQSDAGIYPIREVLSCVDPDAKLALRTQLFDSRGALVRAISVGQTMRKSSGAMAAKKLSITGRDNSVTEVEVYGGDEHYDITADTYAKLASLATADR